MGVWPWPLNAVEDWFQGLWNWIGTAAYNAVGQVYSWVSNAVSGLSSTVTNWFNQIWTWINNAIGTVRNAVVGAVSGVTAYISSGLQGLWSNINNFFSNLWNSISQGLAGVTTYITGAFSSIGSLISSALSQAYTGLSGMLTTAWNSLSSAVSGVGTTLWGGITSLGGAVTSGLGGLWSNISGFFVTISNSVSSGLNAVGSAVSGAVSGFNDMIQGLLSGFATAVGTALQQAFTAVTSGFAAAAQGLLQFVTQDVIQPLASTLNWILDYVSGIFSDFYNSLVSTLRGIGFGTPEGAAVLAVPLLLTSISAVFVMGVLGSVGDIKIMGCGIQLSSLTNQLVAAFGITQIARSVISPILSAAYEQPVRYYWASVFRPLIVSTGTADEFLFHGKISTSAWRQVYAYNGWKEVDIDTRYATVWVVPSQRNLLTMVNDEEVPDDWLAEKFSETGVKQTDIDQLIAFKKRAALTADRKAIATQIETDYRNNVIEEAETRADLAALKFADQDINYRVMKVQFLISRDARAATLKASATPVSKLHSLTEAEVDREFLLGLSTPDQYVSYLQDLKYSASAAQRKLKIMQTPKALTSAEKASKIDGLNDQIAKAKQRYSVQISRQDLDISMYNDLIDYLNGLAKPPATRIVQLQEQITKANGEKSLILQQEDFEVADLQSQLKALGAG